MNNEEWSRFADEEWIIKVAFLPLVEKRFLFILKNVLLYGIIISANAYGKLASRTGTSTVLFGYNGATKLVQFGIEKLEEYESSLSFFDWKEIICVNL